MGESPDTSTAPIRKRRWRWVRRGMGLLLVAWIVMGIYHSYKPLPAGISTLLPVRVAQQVSLLTDITYLDAQGKRHSEQQVFDEVLRLIGQAQKLVVVDMFLFNDFTGNAATPGLRPLSAQLTEALVQRKREVPGLQAVLITDPLNTVYGGLPSPHLQALRAAGVDVVLTDLSRLRTPNPAWSGLWQLCCRWAGNNEEAGWLPNPFGPGKVTLRSYLALLNLNANHRKTLVVDEGDTWTGLVATANPHDGSSAHGNAALRFSGQAALDLLGSERAVALMSGADWPQAAGTATQASPVTAEDQGTDVQLLTESQIRDALLTSIATALPGDRLDIAVFYFSHRGLLREVVAAHRRGVDVRVLLDPNEDAFGRKKNGIPNRQAALEMHEAGVPVRWCDTHGEQCHSKLLLKRSNTGVAELIVGSANYTRRNLDDYNLETSTRVLAQADRDVMQQAGDYYEQSWGNTDGRRISVPYATYADPSRLRYWRYRFTEATGLSSF